jgi:hypothetical protein
MTLRQIGLIFLRRIGTRSGYATVEALRSPATFA